MSRSTNIIRNILYSLENNEQIKTFIFRLRDKHYKRLTCNQIAFELSKQYYKSMKCEMNIESPQRFTEKIQWLKLYDCTKEKQILSDKYLVREWVANIIGEEFLIPLLGAWDDFDEIDFDKLPNEFCLKMNCGSGMNYVVADKQTMNVKRARKLFKTWQKRPYYASSFEFQYRDMPCKIIAEEFIKETGNNLHDYKIHCFGGKPVFIQCIGDRNLSKHTGNQNHYDLEWNKLNWTFEDYPEFTYEMPKPVYLEQLIQCAEKLSRGFAYVRVDLYEVEQTIYFGEMTFTPACGVYPYRRSWTKDKDYEIGQLLPLPASKKEILFDNWQETI